MFFFWCCTCTPCTPSATPMRRTVMRAVYSNSAEQLVQPLQPTNLQITSAWELWGITKPCAFILQEVECGESLIRWEGFGVNVHGMSRRHAVFVEKLRMHNLKMLLESCVNIVGQSDISQFIDLCYGAHNTAWSLFEWRSTLNVSAASFSMLHHVAKQTSLSSVIHIRFDDWHCPYTSQTFYVARFEVFKSCHRKNWRATW